MNAFHAAIVADDRARAAASLVAEPQLARRLVDEQRLHASRIFHWIYVGDTALHLASAGYRVEIARLLIAAGADANSAKNRRRSRPLHYAADGYIAGPEWSGERQVEMLKVLLEAGAEVDAQDANGATALHRAVRTRCAAAAMHLLESGSDPTIRNKSGSMPFHLAVQNTGRGGSGEDAAKEAQRRIVEGFISFGVSPHRTDGRGRSVFDAAQSAWVRDLLAEHRA